MTEPNSDHDELVLMRHLEGRLTAAETAALQARLALEPALVANLEALELENDLITQAVSVPDEIELPEPVMMAIIDQALKDPKRATGGRTWWKPVTLSLGAAAAVVVAVLSSYFLSAEHVDALTVASISPTKSSIKSQLAHDTNPNGPHEAATLLANGAKIQAGFELSSTGGNASMKLMQGITLQFDCDTKIRLVAVQPGDRAIFELAQGALIAEFRPAADADGFQQIEVVTADGRSRLTIAGGRVLVLPVPTDATAAGTHYLVYSLDGQGRLAAADGTGPTMTLVEGTQVLWPLDGLQPRRVAGSSIMRDLLCGWQYEQVHAAGAWWLNDPQYYGLDQNWPVEWAEGIAQEVNAPNFLKQAQSLSDLAPHSGRLPERSDAAYRRWLEMSNTLEDPLLKSQLNPAGGEITWQMLTVKANRMALLSSPETLPPGTLEPLNLRMATALRWLEDRAGQADDDQWRQAAATWLRLETDFLQQHSERNESARYQAFAQQFPTLLESLTAQINRARLAPSGDPRTSQLNAAWQDCHQYLVRMQSKLGKADCRDERERLAQIRAELLLALTDELYAQQKTAAGDEVVGLLPYLNLGPQLGTRRMALETELNDRAVRHAVTAATAALVAGQRDQAERLLQEHVPAAVQTCLPAGQIARGVYTVSAVEAENWARCYTAWLRSGADASAAEPFEQRVRTFLPGLKTDLETTEPAAPAPAVMP